MRAGRSASRTGSPGGRGVGSQTKVRRVLPFSPRDVPTHVRTVRLRGTTFAAIADSTGLGGTIFIGAFSRAASSGRRAQYPLRKRISRPDRLAFTSIG